ncbi:MAG: DUF1232 domain-containing protein [Mycobacteriales bacterium]|nr:DUF1232 domain-containing protein [Mycobacteriales bacterium]
MRPVVLGVGGVLVGWLLLVLALWRGSRSLDMRAAARLVPDLVRLVGRLARDRALPRRTRVGLWLVVAYLASPVDLVPDVVPVLGWADDVVLVLLVLRVVVRRAGPLALERHWPGTPEGLGLVRRAARLPEG